MELLLFLFGLIWGSFLNVCIFRIPEEKSIIWPRSRCRHCNKNIVWYDTIPLISYLILLGKCRFCKKGISSQYPLVELLTAIFIIITYRSFGLTSLFGVYYFFVSILIVISFIDLRLRIIPDVLSLGGIPLGLMCSLVFKTIPIKDALLGALIGFGVLFLISVIYEKITKREGMGGGDVKLFSMLGAFLGYKALLPVMLIASLSGLIVGVTVMIINRSNLKQAIPFGPFLALGAIGYLFWF